MLPATGGSGNSSPPGRALSWAYLTVILAAVTLVLALPARSAASKDHE